MAKKTTIVIGDVFKLVSDSGEVTALVSCTTAAEALEVPARRVTRAVEGGVLRGQQIGREWFVALEDLRRVIEAGGWESLGIRRGRPRSDAKLPEGNEER